MNDLVLGSLACMVLAAGIVLWFGVQKKQNVQTISRRVQRALNVEVPVVVSYTAQVHGALQDSLWVKYIPVWLRFLKAKHVLLIALPTLVVTLAVWVSSSFLIACIVPLLVALIVCFIAWTKWQKMRVRLIQQLPTFIDGMVRMVILGHSLQAAFIAAANTAKPPLLSTVSQAASFAKAGMPIDQAIDVASRDLKIKEFNLLAGMIQIGMRFGGRVDGLLERVSQFMRDREQAGRELHAMSAEVRLSAWILSLLPLLIGGFIIVLNASYFMKMWDDSTGRWLAVTSLGLQAIGAAALYRLARLEE